MLPLAATTSCLTGWLLINRARASFVSVVAEAFSPCQADLVCSGSRPAGRTAAVVQFGQHCTIWTLIGGVYCIVAWPGGSDVRAIALLLYQPYCSNTSIGHIQPTRPCLGVDATMQQTPDMNSTALKTAKTQLRSLMKQRLASIPPDSITSQSS